MGLARKVAPSHRGGAGGKGYRLLGGRSGCSPEAGQGRRDVASAGGWLPLRGPGSSRERTGLQRRPSGADLPSDAGSIGSIPAWGTGLQEFARLVVQPKQTKSSKNKFKKGAEATWPRAASHVCAVCFHRQR